MTTATVNSMNFLIQKSDERINAKVPAEMKGLIRKEAKHKKLTVSKYIKLAIQNQLIKDLGETD